VLKTSSRFSGLLSAANASGYIACPIDVRPHITLLKLPSSNALFGHDSMHAVHPGGHGSSSTMEPGSSSAVYRRKADRVDPFTQPIDDVASIGDDHRIPFVCASILFDRIARGHEAI